VPPVPSCGRPTVRTEAGTVTGAGGSGVIGKWSGEIQDLHLW